MRGVTIGFVYTVAMGAIAAGNSQDVWEDSLDGPLLLAGIAIGFLVFVVVALRKPST